MDVLVGSPYAAYLRALEPLVHSDCTTGLLLLYKVAMNYIMLLKGTLQ